MARSPLSGHTAAGPQYPFGEQSWDRGPHQASQASFPWQQALSLIQPRTRRQDREELGLDLLVLILLDNRCISLVVGCLILDGKCSDF
jgi:hypothetical protein